MSRNAIGSECKDPHNRSDKSCCCGGHSANDRKKNRLHHSTARRIEIRRSRKIKLKGQVDDN